MARPRKNPLPTLTVPPHLSAWAEALGEALGRGVARGINAGLSTLNAPGRIPGTVRTGRPGRPPKISAVPVPPERRCKEADCAREARSKGLCSAHYQAERRRLAK
jgi:hypothetical protein